MAFKDLLGLIFLLISSTNHCTNLSLEHSVKGQFHKGRMISNIYIWLLSHCNTYKEQKGTVTNVKTFKYVLKVSRREKLGIRSGEAQTLPIVFSIQLLPSCVRQYGL